MNKEQRRDCATVLNNAIAEMKEELGDRFRLKASTYPNFHGGRVYLEHV